MPQRKRISVHSFTSLFTVGNMLTHARKMYSSVSLFQTYNYFRGWCSRLVLSLIYVRN